MENKPKISPGTAGDIKETLLKEEAKENIQLSRIMRLLIFVGFTCLSIIMSGDNGVLSSSSKMVKKDLGLSDSEYGIFGSIPSIGRIIGSLTFMVLLQFENRKLISCTCFIINGSLFFVYLLTSNKWILYFVRFAIGTVRIFPHIYWPVWVDQFGIKALKTMMMTVISVTSPLGQVVGFTIGTINAPEKWPYNFALVGTLILTFTLIFVFSPSSYFNGRLSFAGYNSSDPNVHILVDEKNITRIGDTIFHSGALVTKKGGKGKGKDKGGAGAEAEDERETTVLGLFFKGSFIFNSFARANLLFIFQVIHLFIKDYATNGLKHDNKMELLYYYGLATTFGPTAGGMIGGALCNFLTGGYEYKNSAFFVVGCACFCVCAIFPLAFASNLILFCGSIFILFFFASALLPIVSGYVIGAIPLHLKGSGSSLNLLFSNLCGNLPGPVVYGFINDRMKATNPRFAWKCVMFYYFVGFAATLLGCSFRYRDLSRKEEEKKKANEAPLEDVKV